MSEKDSAVKHREVRSFVLREGRMTQGQRQMMEQSWKLYGVDMQQQFLDMDKLFKRSAPRVLEIGFGMGDSLADEAIAHPQIDYLGIEVHRPGVGSLFRRLDASNASNVRVVRDDAVQVLCQMIPDASLDGVYLFFPDPWPKRRHHKRRIVQSAFADLLASKLKGGGVLHMATDWQNYAEHMMTVLNESLDFSNVAGKGNYSPRPDYRPLTKFEKRGQRLGHEVFDLIFIRR